MATYYCITSKATVAQHRQDLGLKGSFVTTKDLPNVVKRQYIFDQMAKDPMGMQGPHVIKEGIVHDTGMKISQYVTGTHVLSVEVLQVCAMSSLVIFHLIIIYI
jgi:hypothetical protein